MDRIEYLLEHTSPLGLGGGRRLYHTLAVVLLLKGPEKVLEGIIRPEWRWERFSVSYRLLGIP